MAEELPLPLEIPWKLASTTQPLAAGDPEQTSISLFFHEPDDEILASTFPDDRIVYLKFTVSISPATIPGVPPVAALGEGVPCFHMLLDLKVRNASGVLGTIRPYFHAAAPMQRIMIQTGVVGLDTFEGESDEQSMGKSGSQMYESTSSRARTRSASAGASFGIGGFSIGGSVRSTTTDVSGSRAVSQFVDTTSRQASEERRQMLSHLTKVENVLTLLNAKYVGTPYLSFSLAPQPLQLLALDPSDPNLWFSQLLSRRSSGIEGVQEFTTVVLVPKGEDFCVSARLRRVCVLDSPPGPFTLDEPFSFGQHLGRMLNYLDRVYPVGTPLDEFDVDLIGTLPTPQEFARPALENWVVNVTGFMMADVISPKPGQDIFTLKRASVSYKTFLEIWLETLRDEYEREVARSPVERGVLLGENRVLDTCFTFAASGLTVSGSTTSVTPLARIVIDPALVDIGGISTTASLARATTRQRAFEAVTRWNLLENRLATLLANRRSFRSKKFTMDDDAVLAVILDRWSRLQAGDPSNLPLDAAATALGLSPRHRKSLAGAGAKDLRSLAQLIKAVPVLERYNTRVAQGRIPAETAAGAPQVTVRLPLSPQDANDILRTIAAALAKNQTGSSEAE
jgi:hypothetical protein